MLPSLDSIISLASLEHFPHESATENSEQRLLSFPIGSQGNALLPLNRINEILRISPYEILPIPKTPTCVLGVYNWRGDMLWLIDLDQLVGYPSSLQQDIPVTMAVVIVVQIEEHYVGLLVRSVNDIEQWDLKQMQIPNTSLFSSRLLPFIKGYLPGGSIILNLEAISQLSLW
jgi:positive phototaxis protein PixI